VTITFTDDGPGISAENINRIFDPFFTTKPQGKGTGLGLSISYGIIREHGGDISVNSMIGHGATFVISLPSVQSAEQCSLIPESVQIGDVEPLSILIVDDEPGILRFIEKTLTKTGHSCDTAGNVDTAMDLLFARSYDVIISDVRLPGKDASVLYQQAITWNAGLAGKFIFMTGDAISPGTSAFLESIDAPFITKPFKITDMVAMIEGRSSRKQSAASDLSEVNLPVTELRNYS
jgi:CheY-like chemotaxis protein